MKNQTAHLHKFSLSSGFTLIEVMIVMAILAILAVGSFASFQGSREQTRDSLRRSELEQIRGAFELYRSDNDAGSPPGYPNSLPACSVAIQLLGRRYLSETPCDPLNGTSYAYDRDSNFAYTLGARMEKPDNQLNNCDAALMCPPSGTTACNFCISNP